jgi:hypothetical protein
MRQQASASGAHLERAVGAPLRDELYAFLVTAQERLDPFL